MAIFSLQSKKQRLFEAFVEEHKAAIYATAFRLCGNQADAEDLVQELLIKLYQMPQPLSELESPRAWLRRVLTNLYIDQYRKKGLQAEKNGDSDEQALDALVSEEIEPEQAAEQGLRQRELHRVLDRLDPELRSLVVLHLVEGHTLESLTSVFDVPIGTLKSRLHRCKAQLRQWIKLEPF